MGNPTEKQIEGLESLLQSAGIGVFMCSADKTVVYISPNLLEMMGYEHESELLGKKISKFYPYTAEIKKILKESGTKKSIYKIVQGIRKDDSIIKFSCTLTKEDDNVIGILSKIDENKYLIPVCTNCDKIRDESREPVEWVKATVYFSRHIDEIKDPNRMYEFSHGICDPCAKKLYPYLYEKPSQKSQSTE